MSSSLRKTFSKNSMPRKRPAPFSIRMSDEERARLVEEAAGAPLGTYVREKLFDEGGGRRSTIDYALLGRVLAVLGESELASSLCLLAVAAEQGALPVDEEIEADLKAACADVRDMRAMLVSALGLRESE